MEYVPRDHPRYRSLMEREKIIEGFKNGIVVINGLISQGRGEAFDYIIGEKTIPLAEDSIEVAVAMLLLSNYPVISVNGNAAALVPDEIINLSNIIDAKIEVNLFYRTEERVKKIIDFLKERGAKEVLGLEYVEGIPGLSSERRKVDPRGILKADVVLVMLEDGDRTEALKKIGKRVIAIDLNPFSRTSMAADVSIMDNVTRAIPLMIDKARIMKKLPKEELKKKISNYNNRRRLGEYIIYIKERLENEAKRLMSFP
ncbi:phosphopantothenate/pantothenate synthetase [Fervidicoccus fontis]|uniref:4-phosphopantoate--beta-alanine ligase n=1 Tax=Fervidicoccus fontis TaxID=683846 RepID=A0A843AEV8_9CREN|nr:4-phosphopantoate--beta-alanine ligase [Fervidicoccus fontis]MBE9391616.1 phosphopantothenate/pantothenate synthetase [Fervidicoccus fontis]